MTLDEIREATKADSIMQQDIKHVKLNDWVKSADEKIKPYYQVKDELTLLETGILLRGTRIVIPEAL